MADELYDLLSWLCKSLSLCHYGPSAVVGLFLFYFCFNLNYLCCLWSSYFFFMFFLKNLLLLSPPLLF